MENTWSKGDFAWVVMADAIKIKSILIVEKQINAVSFDNRYVFFDDISGGFESRYIYKTKADAVSFLKKIISKDGVVPRKKSRCKKYIDKPALSENVCVVSEIDDEQ